MFWVACAACVCATAAVADDGPKLVFAPGTPDPLRVGQQVTVQCTGLSKGAKATLTARGAEIASIADYSATKGAGKLQELKASPAIEATADDGGKASWGIVPLTHGVLSLEATCGDPRAPAVRTVIKPEFRLAKELPDQTLYVWGSTDAVVELAVEGGATPLAIAADNAVISGQPTWSDNSVSVKLAKPGRVGTDPIKVTLAYGGVDVVLSVRWTGKQDLQQALGWQKPGIDSATIALGDKAALAWDACLSGATAMIRAGDQQALDLHEWPGSLAAQSRTQPFATIAPTAAGAPATYTVEAAGQTAKLTVTVRKLTLRAEPDKPKIRQGQTSSISISVVDQSGAKQPFPQGRSIRKKPLSDDVALVSIADPANDGTSLSVPCSITPTGTTAFELVVAYCATTQDSQGTDRYVSDLRIPVEVAPRADATTISGERTLLRGESGIYTVHLTRKADKATPNVSMAGVPLQIKVGDETIATYEVIEQTDLMCTFRVRAIRCGMTTIRAEVKYADGGTEPEAVPFQLSIVEPSGFTKIKVKLQMMDDATAEKAFGQIARRDYYVVQVMMFNNLDPAGKDAGKSILAYSDTIETQVYLEKLRDPKLKSDVNDEPAVQPGGDGPQSKVPPLWKPVVESDGARLGVPGMRDAFSTKILVKPSSGSHGAGGVASVVVSASDTGILTMRAGETRTLDIVLLDKDGKPVTPVPAVKVTVEGPDATNVLKIVEGTTTLQAIADSKVTQDVLLHVSIAVEPTKANLPVLVKPAGGQAPRVYRYRPYVYDLVVNTFEQRAEETGRSAVFRVLDAIPAAASFVSALNTLRGKSKRDDLPFVTDKYSSILLPALRRAFPDQREAQRQNTVNSVMRPVEEIPYGATISRVLFYPKRDFTGYLRGYRTRIAAIDTNFFEVDVAVVDKRERQRGEDTAGTQK